jgi:DNA repair protein SbcD/Mre11
LKILCTGDVHIGRRSSRLPAHLDGHGHSCAVAWTRIVDRAIAEGVVAVCVSGDLVDQSNRYLEAIGPLELGLRRLSEAGIQTLLVSGNHDHDVLPSLVRSIGLPEVRLLGRGGRWERFTLEASGSRLHVDGWSFPQSHFLSSPLREYRPITDSTPTVALLHADLDERGSRYAPISLAEMRRFPETFFLLGHVHAPRKLREPGGARYLYPGSPQAIDRGETGSHGATLLELKDGDFHPRDVPLTTVRFERLDVPVDGIEAPEELDQRLSRAARDAMEVIADQSDHLKCVRFRLRMYGRSRIGRELEARLAELAGDLELVLGEVTGSIESFYSEVRPAQDLTELARGIGAPAILAGILSGRARDERLADQLARVVAEIQGSRSFTEVSGGYEDLGEMTRVAEDELQRAATILLEELLAQKEPRR